MGIMLEWQIRSNNPGLPNVKPDNVNFQYDLLNTNNNKTLRYEERDFGINLGWGNEASGDNIRFQRESGNTTDPILYEEPIAICVNNGSWLKNGHQDNGIDIVWSNDPVFEWTLTAGGNAQGALSMNATVGLYNQKVQRTVQNLHRDRGIDLRWSA